MTGFIVDDVESASRAVHEIGEIDRRNCRMQFENRFTSSRMAQDYVGLYRQLLGGESRSMTVDEGVPVG